MDKEKLERVARKLVEKPKGILAMDESTPTIAKRLESVGVENTEENRRKYRGLLVSANDLGKYISGAIMFEETLSQKNDSGKSFVDILKEQGIIPGIKVDKGAKNMALLKGEKITEGLDGLRERLAKYKEQGAEFAKWRAVLSIGDGRPSDACVEANAFRLAEYAALCQEQGIVPIVEPEILMDGGHDIDKCKEVSRRVFECVFDKLKERGVYLPGIVLKPNMVAAGQDKEISNSEEVAKLTIEVLQETVPESVPGIAFLSGGIGDLDVTKYLSSMNSGQTPWNLTFSFGRGLQRGALSEFAKGDISAAQMSLIERSKASSLATEGKFN